MDKGVVTLNIPNENAMLACGSQLSRFCHPPIVIFLRGHLGAGKTTFVRGFLRGLAYEGKVKSPTYTLVESYSLQSFFIYHFDFYRLNDPSELEHLGLEDYFLPNAICIIEWPEHGGDWLPDPDLSCKIDFDLPGRQISIESCTLRGQTIVKQLQGVLNVCK